jgi:hypothetical protein
LPISYLGLKLAALPPELGATSANFLSDPTIGVPLFPNITSQSNSFTGTSLFPGKLRARSAGQSNIENDSGIGHFCGASVGHFPAKLNVRPENTRSVSPQDSQWTSMQTVLRGVLVEIAKSRMEIERGAMAKRARQAITRVRSVEGMFG